MIVPTRQERCRRHRGPVLVVALVMLLPGWVATASASSPAPGGFSRPSVASLSATTGPTDGGTVMDITGSGFTGVTGVSFGDVPVSGGTPPYFRVNSPTQITAVSPAHGAGTVDVTVVGPGGTSRAVPGDQFTFMYGSWTPAAALGTARTSATLTRLDGPACRSAGPAPVWCGEALIAGGTADQGKPTASAELYDPSGGGGGGLGTWRPVPPMLTARVNHTATLLDDASCHGSAPPRYCGEVLVTGGIGAAGALAAAEIYDPSLTSQDASGNPITGGWKPAGAMQTGRYRHAATLLSGGKVLVTGGIGASGQTGSAELFDPASGAWLPAAPMKRPRASHTATLLDGPACRGASPPAQCGRVLVAGGTGAADPAELFDPTVAPAVAGGPAGAWSDTGTPQQVRSHHSASLLDGSACGVTGPPGYCGKVLVTGGDQGQKTSELYDPGAGTWGGPAATTLTSVTNAPVSATALADGRVLAVGAQLANTKGPFGAELYDGALGSWQPVPPPDSGYRGGNPAVTLAGGSVLIAGGGVPPAPGVPSGGVAAAAERWSLSVPQRAAPVITGPPNPAGGPLSGGTSVTLTGTGLFPTASVRLGDVDASITFNSDAQLVVTSPAHAAGRVQVTVTVEPPSGGTGAPMPAGRFTYFAAQGEWITTKALDSCQPSDYRSGCVGRYGETTTRLDGPACRAPVRPAYCDQILIVGGTPFADPVASAELYNPVDGTWAPTNSMAAPRGSYWSTDTATLLDPSACHQSPPPVDYPCGQVLVVGGENSQSNVGRDMPTELYDPAATDPTTKLPGVWRPVGKPVTPRYGHAAALLDGPACRTASPPSYCGEVLVAGGLTEDQGNGVPTPTAELFNPRAVMPPPGPGAAPASPPPPWVSAPPTTLCASRSPSCQAREGGPGVLLDGPPCHLSSPPAYCGKVLMFTGVVPSGQANTVAFTATAELYDPAGSTEVPLPAPQQGTVTAPGSWEATGSLAIPRLDFTTTVLDGPLCHTGPMPRYCGGVLVAGGQTPGPDPSVSPDTASTELYDPGAQGTDAASRPVAGAWWAVGNLNEARSSYAAAPLADGRVLVSGGGPAVDDRGNVAAHLASAELFDPATSTWTETAPMQAPRGQHTATLLTGQLCEGASPPAFCGHVLVEGGGDASTHPGHATSSAELYVPNLPGACPPPPAAGQLAYPSGSYALIGLPDGTSVPADSLLYGWFDQGEGTYSAQNPTTSVAAGGRGYWAWFACSRAISPPAGTAQASSPLAAGHASMVGNPSGTSPATVNGHDFAARWDPTLNGGAGGYQISGYRQPQSLGVGEGMWVFTYVATTVAIRAGG